MVESHILLSLFFFLSKLQFNQFLLLAFRWRLFTFVRFFKNVVAALDILDSVFFYLNLFDLLGRLFRDSLWEDHIRDERVGVALRLVDH